VKDPVNGCDDMNDWYVGAVTDMDGIFTNAKLFNGDISKWDVGNVKNMDYMFYGAEAFNGDISRWDVREVIYTLGMFKDAKAFNQDISNWNLCTASYMQMFAGADAMPELSKPHPSRCVLPDKTALLKRINACLGINKLTGCETMNQWNVSAVTNMVELFYDAKEFNGDVSNWDVSNVVTMGRMFEGAEKFARDLSKWKVCKGDLPENMFDSNSLMRNRSSFMPRPHYCAKGAFIDKDSLKNATEECLSRDPERGCADMNAWDVSKVTDMSGMFHDKFTFNGDISDWNVSQVTDMSSMFKGAKVFNGDISKWDVGEVSNMESTFEDAMAFNGNLSRWDVGSVISTTAMFKAAESFNSDLSRWNVSSVANMKDMFSGAGSFNSDLSMWDVSNVKDMTGMFQNAHTFNGDLSTWDTSRVTSMRMLFNNAEAFNRDISKWDVRRVTNMDKMFKGAVAFNGDVYNWNVSAVTDMNHMFANTLEFNEDITDWNVSSVIKMNGMFKDAKAFDFDISNWKAVEVTNMTEMFRNAKAFGQDIATLIASKVPRQNCSANLMTEQEDTSNEMFKGASAMSPWNMPRAGTCVDPVRERCSDTLQVLKQEHKWLKRTETHLSHAFSSATSDSGDFVLNKTAYRCVGHATYTSKPWKLIARNASKIRASKSPDDALFLLYSLRAMQKCRKVLDCKYVTVGTDASYRLYKEDQCGTMVPSANHRVYHRASLPTVDDGLAPRTDNLTRAENQDVVKGQYIRLQKIFGPDKGTLSVAEVEVYGKGNQSTNLARAARVCDSESLCAGANPSHENSTVFNGDANAQHPAHALTDGKRDTFAVSASKEDPMFVIDLGSVLNITHVRVYATPKSGGGDALRSSSIGAFVYVLDDSMSVVYAYPLSTPPAGSDRFYDVVVLF
jgi:surface protein